MSDNPQQPGAVPQFPVPPQVSGPHLVNPWGVPFQQPAQPSEPPKGQGAMDIAKLLGLVLTISTIIFGAGKLVAKLENIDGAQKAREEQQAQRERLNDDRYEKLKSAFDAMGKRFEDLTDEVKDMKRQRRGRRVQAPEIDTHP